MLKNSHWRCHCRMGVYISVVSHSHCDMIKELNCLGPLSHYFKVIVKSNKPSDDFSLLCENSNFHWLDERYLNGFGYNNNLVFNYCREELGMTGNDYFVVLNPDVRVSASALQSLIESMSKYDLKLSTINLYRDESFLEYDNSIRAFPSLGDFLASFLGFGNSTIIDKRKCIGITKVDWAAGSFLAFKSSHYEKLSGFDENYFMYCEDIDICYRSKKLNVSVNYHSDIAAVHFAKHANRNFFSKHFYWHVRSVFRFLLSKIDLTKQRSCIKQQR